MNFFALKTKRGLGAETQPPGQFCSVARREGVGARVLGRRPWGRNSTLLQSF